MSRHKAFRSLVALAGTASTARVLNLSRLDDEVDARIPPELTLFHSSALKRAIIVKHRLRAHERELFEAAPRIATKLLIPVDPQDMSCGAYSIMVSQRGYDEVLARDLRVDAGSVGGARDISVLRALDALPSLDPFLVREHLKRCGLTVADDYFELSEADTRRMRDFVETQLLPLVTLCFGSLADDRQAGKLAAKILSSEIDATLEPLRLTLRMSRSQFIEGVFCWKGFLYYKWALAAVTQEARRISSALDALHVRGRTAPEESRYLGEARGRVRAGIVEACREVSFTLRAYDEAFRTLTEKADPIAFREFLLGAPVLFARVGDRLGAVQHITSFWSFRVGAQAAPLLTAPEWVDLFADFENSLGAGSSTARVW